MQQHNTSIILFPRSYNKRGEERLHSVQGVTPDGVEVNVKLRIDAALRLKENPPSISEFSREDIKAKNLCLAHPENSPENREGVLLFTGCEHDGLSKKTIESFTATWGYVLATHSESPTPISGMGRIAMIANDYALRKLKTELEALSSSKPDGWEALFEAKKRQLSDPMLYSFFAHIYDVANELTVNVSDQEQINSICADIFSRLTVKGSVGGALIRVEAPDGSLLLQSELFPRWQKGTGYQSASEVLSWLYRDIGRNQKITQESKLSIIPIRRHSAGQSFKNYYLLRKPEESIARMREYYLINNEPTTCPTAFTFTRKEDTGELFLFKFYPLGQAPIRVSEIGRETRIIGVQQDEVTPGDVSMGLTHKSAMGFPEWYQHRDEAHTQPIGDSEPIEHEDIAITVDHITTVDFEIDAEDQEVGASGCESGIHGAGNVHYTPEGSGILCVPTSEAEHLSKPESLETDQSPVNPLERFLSKKKLG